MKLRVNLGLKLEEGAREEGRVVERERERGREGERERESDGEVK